MKNILLLLILIIFTNCSNNTTTSNYNVQKIENYVVDNIEQKIRKKSVLIAQELNLDEIVIDSLVILKDFNQPYDGYLVTTFKKNNKYKNVYVVIDSIMVNETFICWRENWEDINMDDINDFFEDKNEKEDSNYKRWYE